jgi:hypothetical protein
MNVYQRPLFRQMGGPVAPGMAAQEAMMPQAAAMPPAAQAQDPMAMAQQAQDMAAQQTQVRGAQYAQDTLMNIDRAETPEQIINALRGNEAPMEQRYAELAQFVGDADAQRTPESVLALVQPTIMMTEQGAMDSGIGELMQGLTGEIEMETAEGAPTAMGQGVGSLMMAGANAAPGMGVGQQPVANFRQGGVVQRFQAGGEASRLQQLYSEMLPTYQSILGDGGEQRRLTQAQILFDIADRAGAFAAGVDPRTGQSIARLSPAAQLAAATSGLGGQIGERLGSQEEQDRALRLAALQAAQGEFSAERAAARAAAAAGGSRGIGDAYEAVDRETGQVIATEFLATQAQMDAFRLANEGAIVRKAVAPSTDFDTTTLWGEDGQPVSFVTSTAGGRDEAGAALASGEFTAVAPPAPGDQVVLLNPRNLEDSLVAEAGTAEYNQALRMGFRTAEDIEAQRKLTTPEGETPDLVSFEIPGVDGALPTTEVVDRASPAGQTRISKLLQIPGVREITNTAATTTPVFENVALLDAIATGTATRQQRAVFDNAVLNPPLTVDPNTGETIAGQLPPMVLEAIARAYLDGRQIPLDPQDARLERYVSAILEEQATPEGETASVGETAVEDAVGNIALQIPVPEGVPEPEYLAEVRRDAELAYGSVATAKNFINTILGVIPGMNVPAPRTQQITRYLTSMNVDTEAQYRIFLGDRPAESAIQIFRNTLPTPGSFFQSPSDAAARARATIGFMQEARERAIVELQRRDLPQNRRTQLEAAIINAEAGMRGYRAIIEGIRGVQLTPADMDAILRQHRIDQLRSMAPPAARARPQGSAGRRNR